MPISPKALHAWSRRMSEHRATAGLVSNNAKFATDLAHAKDADSKSSKEKADAHGQAAATHRSAERYWKQIAEQSTKMDAARGARDSARAAEHGAAAAEHEQKRDDYNRDEQGRFAPK
jgi:hypothetical protein